MTAPSRQGLRQTARQWLREHAYVAAAAATDEDEYFAVLTALGIQVRHRVGPETGETTGYSLAAPGDTDAKGEPVFYSGSALAPDLSLNRLRERLTPTDDQLATPARKHAANRRETGDAWRRAEAELRTTYAFLLDPPTGEDTDAQVQAQAAAFAELLHNTAATAPRTTREQLRAAATAFDRANRSAIRAEHQSAYALRQAGKELIRAVGGGDGEAVAALLCTAIYVLIALDRWHEQHGHRQQAAATRQSLEHLQNAYQQSARPALARLAEHAPGPDEARRFAATVRAIVPEYAERILTDPSWPALATALAQAESAGVAPRRALSAAAGQRELDSADRPAEVLVWRLRNATADQVEARARAAIARTHRPATTAPPGSVSALFQQPNGSARRGR